MRGWNVHGLWHGLWVTWPWLNSLWPSDAIRRQRSGSTLAQVMACCLTAPSHYLNQCWLIIIWSQVTFIVGQFRKRCLNHQSLKSIWKVHIWNYIQISQGPMCKNLALNPTGSKKMMQFTIPTIFFGFYCITYFSETGHVLFHQAQWEHTTPAIVFMVGWRLQLPIRMAKYDCDTGGRVPFGTRHEGWSH